MELLGTIISNDLKWDLNTANLVKRANARMELLRRVAGFGTPEEDLKTIYILFIRSILEQSATVWHSSLTEDNKNDLERIQKSAVKVILKESYKGYIQGLHKLDLLTLDERRDSLCLEFAQRCVKNKKMTHMFPKNTKTHDMNTRAEELYNVQHANTQRLKDFDFNFDAKPSKQK